MFLLFEREWYIEELNIVGKSKDISVFCSDTETGRKRRQRTGDKSKKDKDKGRKQKVTKEEEKARKKSAKQPKRA
jgi:hypothetical protein